MEYSTEILHMGFITHDVKQFIVRRPEGFAYDPGQGVEVAVDADGRREDARPFTPTSPRDAPTLEFLIKVYPERDAVTEELHSLKPGAALLLSQAFGTITYRGPGTFIGAGAGVTPLLAILRHIEDPKEVEECTLLFSNKTP
ncbi:MAG TPA: FAD-binding oxidoreductase, partial [Longimicrobiales bacterium]|nr:FAD-binding oxidoreductase [Longimicrobiales bacterium]